MSSTRIKYNDIIADKFPDLYKDPRLGMSSKKEKSTPRRIAVPS